MINFKKNKNKGFTFIELMIVIFIMTVGITSIYTSITRIISSTTYSTLNLTANYLAQEGIEIVKSIRDSNFLDYNYIITGTSTSWKEGLSPGDYEADYNDYFLYSLQDNESRFLKVDEGDFFSYADNAFSVSPFKRKITITENPNNENVLNVSVTVYWTEKGKTNETTVSENLYNLYPLSSI
ncbi:MAG TPA: prepilin-type N-terminal cleavage/methylation domain-containing protein [Candidatus Pacearchaeota archaeon]|jgi:prepilin-type N-terminal cleavage/methylation domain-containing protein|nr:prepilin-type N-terminal cleavage/methylation domain-containing protein [Candidatus Pacearchaeota archaeon]